MQLLQSGAIGLLRWLRAYRVHCSVALLILSALLLQQRSETVITPENQLRSREVVVEYAGKLEKVASRSGINHGSTKFNAGYGIGFKNDLDQDELMLKLRPVIYLPFADLLDAGHDVATKFLATGSPIHIRILEGEIVAADGPNGPLIAYSEYLGKLERRRTRWMIAAALAAVGSVLVLAVTAFKAHD